MPAQGEELIERCKQHVIATLRTLPECAPTGTRAQKQEHQNRLRPYAPGRLVHMVIADASPAGQENSVHHPRQKTWHSAFSINLDAVNEAARRITRVMFKSQSEFSR